MTSTSDTESGCGPLRHDAFLGGRLTISQPVGGYLAGADAVFLGAAVDATAGQTLLDLGCGAGVAMLCAAFRVPGLIPTGVEVQTDYVALARHNAAANAISAEVICADLRAMPPGVRSRRFDHVIANPPYHPPGAGRHAADAGRDIARAGETPLAVWLDVASRRLAPRGRLALIQRIDRLPQVLQGLPPSVGSVVVLPLVSREGRAPERFVLWGIKGGRAAFRLADPMVMHSGPVHSGAGDDHAPAAAAILRGGAKLCIPS